MPHILNRHTPAETAGMKPQASILLSENDRKLLSETRTLLDGILETLDILSNPREVRGIKKALKEVKEGKVRPWNQFEKELTHSQKL